MSTDEFRVGDIVFMRGSVVNHLIYIIESVDEVGWSSAHIPGELIKVRGYLGKDEYVVYASRYALVWPAEEE